MAGIDKITCVFYKDFLEPPTRTHSDLPPHVTGSAHWNVNQSRYYIPKAFTPNNKNAPVEFINNCWYYLYPDPNDPNIFLTNASSVIPITNHLRLGYWDPTDPEHPNFIPTAPITVDPPSTHQKPAAPPSTSSQALYVPITAPPVPIAPTIVPPTATMSASATTTASAPAPAPSGGL